MTEQEQKQDGENELYKNPEEMSDEELAEAYKSYYLQIQNQLPHGLDEIKYLRQLRTEMSSRLNLEVLESVRVLNDTGEVLVE